MHEWYHHIFKENKIQIRIQPENDANIEWKQQSSNRTMENFHSQISTTVVLGLSTNLNAITKMIVLFEFEL